MPVAINVQATCTPARDSPEAYYWLDEGLQPILPAPIDQLREDWAPSFRIYAKTGKSVEIGTILAGLNNDPCILREIFRFLYPLQAVPVDVATLRHQDC